MCHKIKILFAVFLIICASTIIHSQVINENEKWTKVIDGLNFPEGPAYDGISTLYFSNCYGGWITEYSEGKVDTFLVKNNSRINISKTNGLAVGNDGNLYICEYGYGQILRADGDKNLSVYANGFNGERFNRPNDLILDEDDNLYFTDPKSYDKDNSDGRVFFIDAQTNEIKLAAENLAFPNGINISPIDKKLYVCESAKQKIVRFTITKDHNLINKEDFAFLPGGDPDGIEFDIKGNLYVAHFGGKAIYIFSPEGKQLQKITTPGSKPTNLEFGGDDNKTLFLTEVETNALYKINANITGK